MSNYDIGKLHQEMEIYLIQSMKRNLSRHLKEESKYGFDWPQWQAEKLKELKKYQKENASIVGKTQNQITREVSKQLREQFIEGTKSSQKQFKKAERKGYKPNIKVSSSFFKINDRKANSLIKSVNNDLKTANTAALRMINDQYREIIYKAATFASNGVMTEKQAIDMATKDFLSRGINCIEYSNGARVNIASYSKMAVRTANQRAQLMGEGEFRKKVGNPLVIISKHGTACKLCQKWESKILIDDVYSGGKKDDGNYTLLSEAMKQGLYHPNCKHGLGTYYPELDGIEFDEQGPTEETLKQYQQDINYCNLQIQKYRRLEIGSLDGKNIRQYHNKKKQWENIKTDLLTPEEREQIRNYTGVDAQKINSAIRKNHITDEIQKKIDLLDSAISKSPKLSNDMIVCRGTIPQSLEIFKNKIKVTDEDMLNLKGTIQSDLAFMSTSSKAPETIGRNVIMNIKLPKGYQGALSIKKYAHEKFKYQEEILLKRGNKFKIVDVIIKENKYYLEVEMKP